MSIRFVEESDWKSVIAIYNEAIALGNATAHTTPVSVESRAEWFRDHTEEKYPIYVVESEGELAGWCSISPYRPDRKALRFTAEISYYVSQNHRRKGIASRLINHAIGDCSHLGIKTLFGILLDTNEASIFLLKKLGFEEWGHLPDVADFDGCECGHLYYGKRIG